MVRNGNQNIWRTRAGPHPRLITAPVIANLGVSNSRPETRCQCTETISTRIHEEYTWKDPSSGLTWIKLDGGVMVGDQSIKLHSWDAKFPSPHVDSFTDARRFCTDLRLL
jgi:hypothetical protein